MYKITLQDDLTVLNVYDIAVYDDGIAPKYDITEQEFKTIQESGRHDFWQYKDGKIVESEFKAEILRNEFNAQQKKKRRAAYAIESDPVFFKSQRGEATNQEWLDAVAAVNAKFPYQA
jgi:hypothetical protein